MLKPLGLVSSEESTPEEYGMGNSFNVGNHLGDIIDNKVKKANNLEKEKVELMVNDNIKSQNPFK